MAGFESQDFDPAVSSILITSAVMHASTLLSSEQGGWTLPDANEHLHTLESSVMKCMLITILSIVRASLKGSRPSVQENDVEREYQIHRTEEDYALAEFWKWALAFLIGVAMGCIGFIVDWGIQTLNDFKYYHTVALIASRGATPTLQLQERHALAHTLLHCPYKWYSQAPCGGACCCRTALLLLRHIA